MKLIQPRTGRPRRLGILPGSFNPVTRAHVALARGALEHVDQVLFVLPATFPHKAYEGATLEQRIEMLERITASEPRFSAAISINGLFIDIAHEAREHYPNAQLLILCGRDAAERIVNWDYGSPGAIERMLEVFHLLVAPRSGKFEPPPHLAHAIHFLPVAAGDNCSATRVRNAIATGREWRDLVPNEIVDLVQEIYRA